MQQISITKGTLILVGNKKLEIVAAVSSTKIKAVDINSGEVVLVSPGEIEFELKRPLTSLCQENDPAEGAPCIKDVDETQLNLASGRFAVLLPLVGKRLIPKDEMARCTTALKLSTAQVYRLLARIDTNLGPLSLIPRQRGRSKGTKLIDASAEAIIQEAIDEDYRGPGATSRRIIDIVKERCLAMSIQAPSTTTITNRIKAHRPRTLLAKKSGTKAARQAYEIRGGKVQPEAPLDLIQIDHALVDCIIVDSEQRLPLVRPWVTIAIDVYTRVVLGFYLSLSYPSAMSVALCISHSILPKERWLKAYGFTGEEYPFYGMPKRIHVDNAKEFRSKNLSDSCRKYGIELTFRPRGTPHNGAHIERLIGTLMGKVHMLPGTTMSSSKEKGHYKSERHAALSFTEFREWFIREIEIYHITTHSALGCSPLLRWEKHFQKKDGSYWYPPIVEDRMRLLVDFMPVKKRVIGRAGIRLNTIDYYSSTLKRFDIGTKCTVRYDPESLSKVWVLPSGEQAYIELGYADLRLPNTTLSEFKRLRAKLKDESERRVPASEVFNLIAKNEALVSASIAKNKQVRKTRERKRNRSTDAGHPLNEKVAAPSGPESVDYSVKPEPYTVEE